MRRLLVGRLWLIAVAGLVLPTGARPQAAQEEQTASSLTIIYIAGAKSSPNDPLRRDTTFSSLYLLGGPGSHSVALAGDDAIALVDTKGPGWGEALRVKAGLTTDVPIELIINPFVNYFSPICFLVSLLSLNFEQLYSSQQKIIRPRTHRARRVQTR